MWPKYLVGLKKRRYFLKLFHFFAFRIFMLVLFEGLILFQDRLVCHVTAWRYRGYLIGTSHNVIKKHDQSPFYEASNGFIRFVFATFSTIYRLCYLNCAFHRNLLPVSVRDIKCQRTNSPHLLSCFSTVLIMRISLCIKIKSFSDQSFYSRNLNVRVGIKFWEVRFWSLLRLKREMK